MTDQSQFMNEAIALSRSGMLGGKGGPFGAVVVKDGEIIVRACNQVTSTNDPTAHAEVVAIREACRLLNTWQLSDCEIYTSCEPCPMCLGAIYWARPKKVYYGNTKEDAAAIGFDDHLIYDELEVAPEKRQIPMTQMMRDDANTVFQEWAEKNDRVDY